MRALARFLCGPALAWAVLSAALLACTDPAGAQPRASAPEYSHGLAVDREQLLILNARTRRCMFYGAEAMFRQGVTDRNFVTLFTIRSCSSAFGSFLRDRAGWRERDAAELVVAMSDQEYDAALSWGARGPR